MSNKFEKSLWGVRYITILPVLLSIISSVALLVLGGWEIIEAIIFYNPLFDDSITNSNELLFKIISAIDLFLIGIVLLIFGFGIYELFVSEIDFANSKFNESTLKIRDLDQLKNKIIKFREDELHHKDIAYKEGATKKGIYSILDKVIKTGSKIAINISEKI